MAKIEVKSKEFTKLNDDEFGKKGDKFKSYKGYSKKLGWTDLKLTQSCDVKELPRFCTLEVNPNQISIDRKAKFPIIWISDLKENQVTATDLVTNVEDYFD